MIEAKDLMMGLTFEAYGTFSGITDWTPEGGERIMSYRFDYLGGQFSVQVDENELLSPPDEGTPFRVVGRVKYNNRSGSITLVPVEKKRLAELTPEQFVKGLTIVGAGVVEDKKVTTMNRNTFMKCTLKWQGGLHLFKDVSPEMFQRIPSRGKYVRFQLGVTTYTERGDGGRQVQHQLPVLLSIQPEELSVGTQPKPPQGDPSQAKTRSA